MNDGFGGMIHEKSMNHLLVGDVKLFAVERDDLMRETEKTSGAASDKSGCACDENFHCEKNGQCNKCAAAAVTRLHNVRIVAKK